MNSWSHFSMFRVGTLVGLDSKLDDDNGGADLMVISVVDFNSESKVIGIASIEDESSQKDIERNNRDRNPILPNIGN